MKKPDDKSPVFPTLPGRYGKMTAAEWEKEVAQFDEESLDDYGFKPLTPQMRAAWNRAKKRKPGRPRVGKGAKRVLVTIEGGLLKAADSHAKKQGVSRSALFAQGLRKVLDKIA